MENESESIRLASKALMHSAVTPRGDSVQGLKRVRVPTHSLASWDSCPTQAKSEGIEYLQSWPYRN